MEESPGAPARVTVGHPVDVVSGVVYTAWHDFEFSGFVPLIWRRFYSTSNLGQTPLGRGWWSLFFMEVRPQGNMLELINEEGRGIVFPRPQPGEPYLNTGAQMELRLGAHGCTIWYWHHQTYFHFSLRRSTGAFALTRIEDYSGNSIDLVYDQQQRLTGVRQSTVERGVILRYGDQGLISQIDFVAPGTAPEYLVSYEHGPAGELLAATDAMGHAISYQYDDQFRLARETGRLGGSFFFRYDPSGRCVESVGDGGYLRRVLSYDRARKVTSVTDSLGFTTLYHYNEAGVVEKKILPDGGVVRQLRAPAVRQKILAQGETTTRELDEFGNVVKDTDPLGRVHEYVYDQMRCCTQMTTPDGAIRQWQYDERGRLMGFRDPLDGEWKLERGPLGEVMRQVDPEGGELRRSFGPALRWQEFTNSAGVFRCEYDAYGRCVLNADARGTIVRFEMDSLGRLAARHLPDGSQIRLQYDPAGNMTEIRFPQGDVWRYEYDRFGHVTRAIFPDGGIVTCEYDSEGRRTVMRNQRGELLTNHYDFRGKLVQRQNFDGTTESYEYDLSGNLVAITRADGSKLRCRYDAAWSLTKEWYQPPNGEPELFATFEFDWHHRLCKASNSAATIQFDYDPAGRLVREKQNEFEVIYGYDRAAKLISRRVTNGPAGLIKLEYTDAALLRSVADAAGTVQEFRFDETARLRQRSLRGGITELLEYNQRREVALQEVRQNGRLLVRRAYTYNAADLVATLQDATRGNFAYTYGSRPNLVLVMRNSREQEEFRFEPGGDLIRRNGGELRYSPGSRLIEANGEHFAYDQKGYVVARDSGHRRVRYSYDVKGRLLEARGDAGPIVTFGYDPIGRRVVKKTPVREERYVWSRSNLAAVFSDDAPPQEFLIGRVRFQPAIQWVGGDVYHIVTDRLGTPGELLDTSGNTVWWARFSAFGSMLDSRSTTSAACPLRFPGQYEDPETGLYYNLNRYYDPTLGRYLTPDPIGISGGLNLYDYPRDPVNWTDPLGLKCPNPKVVQKNDEQGWTIYEHDDGTQTITADCTKGFATEGPTTLRDTAATDEECANSPPEAHLGQDDRLIVMEGKHRAAAASQGQQIPPDPANPSLGGVPGQPGVMSFEYCPQYNDPDQEGTPLQQLKYPPGYPHQL